MLNFVEQIKPWLVVLYGDDTTLPYRGLYHPTAILPFAPIFRLRFSAAALGSLQRSAPGVRYCGAGRTHVLLEWVGFTDVVCGEKAKKQNDLSNTTLAL